MERTISEYGGIKQRWLLVYSEQAFQREQLTFQKKNTKRKRRTRKRMFLP
jgi:hypothetical protein